MIIDLSDKQLEGIIKLLLGTIVFVSGTAILLKRMRVLRIGVKTTGTVMKLVPGIGRNPVYYPVIRFEINDGKYVMKEYEIGKMYRGVREGDDISVIYNKEQPEEFIIDDLTSKLIGPTLVILGLVVIAVTASQFLF